MPSSRTTRTTIGDFPLRRMAEPGIDQMRDGG